MCERLFAAKTERVGLWEMGLSCGGGNMLLVRSMAQVWSSISAGKMLLQGDGPQHEKHESFPAELSQQQHW
jgi:hypothetical protein